MSKGQTMKVDSSFLFSVLFWLYILTFFLIITFFRIFDRNIGVGKLILRQTNQESDLLVIKSKYHKILSEKDHWILKDNSVSQNKIEVLGMKTSISPALFKKEDLKISDYIHWVYFFFPEKRLKVNMTRFDSCITFYRNTINCKNSIFEVDKHCLKKVLYKIKDFKSNYSTLSSNEQSVRLLEQDFRIDFDSLFILFKKELVRRFDSCKKASSLGALYIIVPIDTKMPNTDGRFSKRYIEVDGSRQLLFFWEDGKYEVFSMSGAYPPYNPVGIYRFYYKSLKSWSKWANVWMPYWMAFSYDKKTGARFGVHGLIYHCPGRKGKYCDNYIFESEENLGKPKSKGCLRVSVKDAKYLYSKIQVGDYIIVHD